MSRRSVIVILLLAACVAGAGTWIWLTSPVLRYRVLRDPASFSQVFETLKKNDTMEHVRSVLGDRYLDPDGERWIRDGFQGLATAHPEHHPDGYRESDAVLAYSADQVVRLGILFRDGRIIAFCSQRR